VKDKKDFEFLQEAKKDSEQFSFDENINEKQFLNEDYVFHFEDNQNNLGSEVVNEIQSGNEDNPYQSAQNVNKKDALSQEDIEKITKSSGESLAGGEVGTGAASSEAAIATTTTSAVGTIATIATTSVVILVGGGMVVYGQNVDNTIFCQFQEVYTEENNIYFLLQVGSDEELLHYEEQMDVEGEERITQECDLVVELTSSALPGFALTYDVKNYGYISGEFLDLEIGYEYSLNVYQNTFLDLGKTYLLEEPYMVSLSSSTSLVSIILSGDYQTTYRVGDTFDTSNMVITVYYDNEEYKEVDVSEVTFTGYDMSKEGEQEVTISYSEDDITISTTFMIEVLPSDWLEFSDIEDVFGNVNYYVIPHYSGDLSSYSDLYIGIYLDEDHRMDGDTPYISYRASCFIALPLNNEPTLIESTDSLDLTIDYYIDLIGYKDEEEILFTITYNFSTLEIIPVEDTEAIYFMREFDGYNDSRFYVYVASDKDINQYENITISLHFIEGDTLDDVIYSMPLTAFNTSLLFEVTWTQSYSEYNTYTAIVEYGTENSQELLRNEINFGAIITKFIPTVNGISFSIMTTYYKLEVVAFLDVFDNNNKIKNLSVVFDDVNGAGSNEYPLTMNDYGYYVVNGYQYQEDIFNVTVCGEIDGVKQALYSTEDVNTTSFPEDKYSGCVLFSSSGSEEEPYLATIYTGNYDSYQIWRIYMVNSSDPSITYSKNITTNDHSDTLTGFSLSTDKWIVYTYAQYDENSEEELVFMEELDFQGI